MQTGNTCFANNLQIKGSKAHISLIIITKRSQNEHDCEYTEWNKQQKNKLIGMYQRSWPGWWLGAASCWD